MVREHEELVFISESGMVQRTGVRGISRYGRLSQGVRLMNVKEGDRVSAVALVVESEEADVVSGDGQTVLWHADLFEGQKVLQNAAFEVWNFAAVP